ncbi:MAG TPA: hypothetical protein VLH58_04120, partial [Candidatus Methylomirabilis sp.]|nr:hypothetical protein [Candidatus Methylomirabilis sp.]
RLADLTTREVAVLVPVVLLIVWIGIYPRPFLVPMEASVKQLLAQVHIRYRAAEPRGSVGSHARMSNIEFPTPSGYPNVGVGQSASRIPQSEISSGMGPRMMNASRGTGEAVIRGAEARTPPPAAVEGQTGHGEGPGRSRRSRERRGWGPG